jgi:tRNA-2-methylthio-N6-dimethylallyladenosine synthase
MAHMMHPVGPYPVGVTAGGRTYQIRTYGCQMNAHDSERLAGLLDEAGYRPAREGQTPDVVVFNTCAVRENAADRLYGNLGHLLPQKKNGMQIAVGGCLAQMERTRITQRAPWVDVVYGTHNMGSLPALLERARVRNEAQVEFAETLETFPSLLPARRQSAYSAWVSISVGCNNTCTFCIVPSLRGKERDRRPGDILAEIGALVADGVLEVTLLGQNVNSYGAEFGDRKAFGKLLRSCGEIEGLERVRFTSPHPRDFTDDVIDAMAQTPNVMPSLHMPLQSGSDAVLKAMRRAYRRDRYLAILDRVRAAIPDAAITTDIIVGFPGETDQDFEQTLDLVRRAQFAGAFTFRYSIRPGTPAATMDGQVPADVVQERYERLVALVEETTFAENQKLTGATVEVLVAEGEGRKDAATHRMSGRARDNRLVHFTPHAAPHHEPNETRVSPRSIAVNPGVHHAAPAAGAPRPGDVVTVTVTRAAPHYLLSDAAPLSLRRTRAGDAWEAAATAPAPAAPVPAAPVPAATAPATPSPAPATPSPTPATPSPAPVLLGMPARHP